MSDTIDQVVELVEKMSLLEVADLVKALVVKFGVSAAAPVAVAAAGVAPAYGLLVVLWKSSSTASSTVCPGLCLDRHVNKQGNAMGTILVALLCLWTARGFL